MQTEPLSNLRIDCDLFLVYNSKKGGNSDVLNENEGSFSPGRSSIPMLTPPTASATAMNLNVSNPDPPDCSKKGVSVLPE